MRNIGRGLCISLVAIVLIAACSTSTQAVQESPTPFEVEKLIVDVFAPQPGEKVLVMVDLPEGEIKDYGMWADRREMAREWHAAFQGLEGTLGIDVHLMLFYAATGAHNGPLPESGTMGGKQVLIDELFADSNIIVALTEFSATAPLVEATKKYPNLRVASMPMVSRGMEQTALAADYAEVARKCQILGERLNRAVGAEVVFSTGHEFYFDLRHRHAEVDDGQLHADKVGARVINLPSGEAYIAPYEGELEGQPSETEGMLPVMFGGELVVGRVVKNLIVEVIGDGPYAVDAREHMAMDYALRNIAELGLGCNDKAVVTGNVLEDEKVLGMHWAYGRSEHIGGTVGPEDFSDPSLVTHRDYVYPRGGAIEIASLVLQYEDGGSEEILHEGYYTVFGGVPFGQRLIEMVDSLLLVWLLLAAGSLSILAWDMENIEEASRVVKAGWALVTLVFGPIGLLVYNAAYRKPRWSANAELDLKDSTRALASAMYSAAGYVIAIFQVIGSILYFQVNTEGPSTVILLYAQMLLVGLLVLRAPYWRATRASSYGEAVRKTVLAEIISVNLAFVGMISTIFYLQNQWFPDGFDVADPLFAVMMLIAAGVGALAVYPFNLWMGHQALLLWPGSPFRDEAGVERESEVILSLRNSWVALVISFVLLAGWLAWMTVNTS
jgi:hypothetical protein